MFYKILDDYIELYKLNGRNALENMKSHYDCEEEYWAIIEELLDRYIDLQSKIDKANEYIDLKSNVNGYDKNKLLDILKEDK